MGKKKKTEAITRKSILLEAASSVKDNYKKQMQSCRNSENYTLNNYTQ